MHNRQLTIHLQYDNIIDMAIEIEAKYKVDRLENYAELVKQLGGRLHQIVLQRDRFFDRPDKSLLKSDSGLRLREQSCQSDATTSMCSKGPRLHGNYKKRQELEFEISDLLQAQQLLEALGYKQTMIIEKTRQLWQLDRCLVCLDNVTGLGCFIEIEGPDEDAIRASAQKLGLDKYPTIIDSYAMLLTEKEK